jgi:dUTPase
MKIGIRSICILPSFSYSEDYYFIIQPSIMKVRIKNSTGKALEYKTTGACAFDFESQIDVVFAPGEWKLIETGTVIETPEGYCLVTAPRSSIFKNY